MLVPCSMLRDGDSLQRVGTVARCGDTSHPKVIAVTFGATSSMDLVDVRATHVTHVTHVTLQTRRTTFYGWVAVYC